MKRHGQDETGAGVVLVIAMIGVLVLVAVAAGMVVAVISAHRRTQNAADLAALAAAGALQRGADPCTVAAAFAESNGAQLADCDAGDQEVRVVVARVVTGIGFTGDGEVRARARAGW